MQKYFGVSLEFDHLKFENIIDVESLSSKGYGCFVDSTSLTHAYKNQHYREILNEALVNSCDGSYIAMMASRLHKKKFRSYIGPDFFSKFVLKPYKQLLIGGNEQIYDKILNKVTSLGANPLNFKYLPIPFLKVEEFDYSSIADEINRFSPRFIWVSLGAPKQETFMHHLMPNLDRGVMIGVGAAFNYYTGEIKEIPDWARKTNLIWLYRILTEPKKQLRRCKEIIGTLPKMYVNEKNRIKRQLK
ncbi:WecB/TagA/CpsF family glycosyltransferase [Parapedobacter tibetensis]|uniref:WecB/TagA/CpsF family glycosyltransferase n=1 Tax=Parapedobacter tibetensis TaxID=2972951 RepID=UPI00214D99DF|nr:WecB/TagA/CpsF family glycosyltransferase [Parapedobacter tibetensis]